MDRIDLHILVTTILYAQRKNHPHFNPGRDGQKALAESMIEAERVIFETTLYEQKLGAARREPNVSDV